MRFSSRSITAIALFLIIIPLHQANAACDRYVCDGPEVTAGSGALNATYVTSSGQSWSASKLAPEAHPYTYRLSSPCAFDAAAGNACRAEDDAACPAPPDREIGRASCRERV